MTTIRVSSVCHGTVDVTEDDVVVIIPDDFTPPHYLFLCPECGSRNDKMADPKIVQLLTSAGCDVVNVAREAAAAHDDKALKAFLDDGKAGV